jgi:hypothetical protein
VRRALVAVLLGSISCGEKPLPTNPPATIEPAPPPHAGAVATVSAKRVTVSEDAIRTRMPEIGVSVVLPPETEPAYDETYKRYVFRLSDAAQGLTALAETPAPNSDQEAMALWADAPGAKALRVLEHGGGGLEPWWGVTSFEVRMGVEGRPGMHRLQRVTRVEGVLALEAGKHAKCTVALEYDVELGGRPVSLDEAIGICKSMRPLR